MLYLIRQFLSLDQLILYVCDGRNWKELKESVSLACHPRHLSIDVVELVWKQAKMRNRMAELTQPFSPFDGVEVFETFDS